MQLSSINLKPHSSVGASPDINSSVSTSLPLMSNVTNINIGPLTTSSIHILEYAGAHQTPILHQLRYAQQSCQVLLHKSEEHQFISVLRSLSKLDELYYDEDLLKSLTINDPRKYYYLELFTSALYTKAACYRAKNRILELMHFIPKEKKSSIVQGKIGLAVAITNLINNKIKHQSCLSKIQLEDFGDLSNSTSSESGQKKCKFSSCQIARAKRTLSEYRRYYDYSLAQRGIEESAILENFPQCLSDDYTIKAIKKIFVSLPEEKIKTLIQSHASSLSSSVDKMEAHAFKVKRKPVPESFWNSLRECDIKDRDAFHRHFFLFLLSNGLSEPEYQLWQKRELEEAITTNNAREECNILINKSFQLSLLIAAQKVFDQVLALVKEYDNLKSAKGTDEVELALAWLNNAYTSAFTKVYQPYIERKTINWNLKTREECQAQVNLLNAEINITTTINTQLFDEKDLDVEKLLNFIYAVLLHFRDNQNLTDLKCIAASAVNELTAKQIQKNNTRSKKNQIGNLDTTVRAAKIKRKEELQDGGSSLQGSFVAGRNFQISPYKTNTDPYEAETDVNAEGVTLSLGQEKQLIADIQDIRDGGCHAISTQEQMLEHEEYRKILGLIMDRETESCSSQSMLALAAQKVAQVDEGCTRDMLQSASQNEGIETSELELPSLRFSPQLTNSEIAPKVGMLNFDSQSLAEQRIALEQEVILAQLFPKLVETTPMISNIQEEMLTVRPQITDTSALFDVYDFGSDDR